MILYDFSDAPFYKSSTTSGTTATTPDPDRGTTVHPAGYLPYFETDLDKGQTTLFPSNNPVCQI